MTSDKWHMTHDTWHVTRDMWHLVGVNILSKFKLPSSYGLGWQWLEDSEQKDHRITELIKKVFVEQPQLHRVCYIPSSLPLL